MKTLFLLVLLTLSSFSAVLNKVKSQFDVQTSIENIQITIKQKAGFGVFKTVDHQKNAENVGLVMPPLQVVIFGNAKGGTPLMQTDPRIAYKLPLKIMAYEDAAGQVWLAYKEPLEFEERFDLQGSPIPGNLTKLLKSLVMQNALEGAELILSEADLSQTPELVQMKALHDVNTTINNLSTSINEKLGFGVFARIDHQKNAAKVGLEMRASQVLFFGNAKAGTPLMLKDPMIGHELPLKIAVYEDENGQVWIEYKNPHLYSRDFSLDELPIPTKMANLLAGLSKAQGTLDFETRSKTNSSSIHADQTSTFKLQKDGSVILSKQEVSGEIAFIVMKMNTRVDSGFISLEGIKHSTYPKIHNKDENIKVSLESKDSDLHIRFETKLTELVYFKGE